MFQHLRQVHHTKTANQALCGLTCSQNGCSLQFETFKTFRTHLKYCDKYLISQGQVQFPDSMDSAHNDDDTNVEVLIPNFEALEVSSNENVTAVPNYGAMIGMFLLELKTEKSCTHSALNVVVEFLLKLLNNLKNEPEALTKILDACKSLRTQKKRKSFFQKEMNYYDPVEITLFHKWVRRRDKVGRAVPVNKQVTFQYIPIKPRLEALFSHEKFRQLYFAEKASADGFMRSDRDAEDFNFHPLFSKKNVGLRFQIWADEVEFCNPLGPKKSKKGKIATFAFSILNLPIRHNSLLANIHPFAIVRSVDLKRVGYNRILAPFMNEIRELESDMGMKLILKGFPDMTLQGSLKSVCGDTLGAHDMFGLMTPSANIFCRLCLTKRNEILEHSS